MAPLRKTTKHYSTLHGFRGRHAYIETPVAAEAFLTDPVITFDPTTGEFETEQEHFVPSKGAHRFDLKI